LYYWFQYIRPELERIAAGSTIKTIGLWYFDKMRIPLPPITLQRAVSAAFLELDALADGINRLLSAKQLVKRGLVQLLLSGKVRFPEFAGRPWVVRELGDFFHEKAVFNKNRDEARVYSCTKSAGIVPQTDRFGKRLASADLARYKVVEPGDLVSIGFVPCLGRGVVSPAYETFVVSPDGNRDYLWPLIKSYNVVARYKQISQGTNTRRKKAHPREFLKLTVPMPPSKAEQDRVAEVLREAQSEIDLLGRYQEHVVLEKRALLARFLAGDFTVHP
jgi:type I restriction enzyme S subunit